MRGALLAKDAEFGNTCIIDNTMTVVDAHLGEMDDKDGVLVLLSPVLERFKLAANKPACLYQGPASGGAGPRCFKPTITPVSGWQGPPLHHSVGAGEPARPTAVADTGQARGGRSRWPARAPAAPRHMLRFSRSDNRPAATAPLPAVRKTVLR